MGSFANNLFICNSSPEEQEKICDPVSDYSNVEIDYGTQINVLFINGNTAEDPFITIPGVIDGFYIMSDYETNVASSPILSWKSGSLITLTFCDNLQWVCQNNQTNNFQLPICVADSSDSYKLIKFGELPFSLYRSSYFPVIMTQDNTYQGALYGFRSGQIIYPIYINDTISSATNYTLPANLYFVFYNSATRGFYFRTDGKLPGTMDYLPLSAGQEFPLTGPLGLTENTNYGTTLPSAGFEGQLFFLEEEEKPSLPVGGTEGQYLVKNSSTDGDASWKTLELPSLDYLPLSGGTLTGAVTGTKIYTTNEIGISNGDNRLFLWADTPLNMTGMSYEVGTNIHCIFGVDYTSNKVEFNAPINFIDRTDSTSTTTGAVTITGGLGVAKNIYGSQVFGAVWNDYAEYRISNCLEAGRVICENGDDTLSISANRLQPGANIISDTFGFAIGETELAKCPVAVSGRVLAYTYEPRDEFNPGEAVCAGPNGTVSRMTREEIRNYPERIIGTVSAIPSYEYWGENNVPVNGRIWIKVK